MAKKLKKARKGMSPEAKFTLASSFKGLISNQAVIDGSRASGWWVAAIFFAFSVILPLVPTFSKLSSANGGSYLTGYNYGLDEQLSHFVYTAHKSKFEFKVEGGKLHYYQGESEQSFNNPNLNEEKYFTNWEADYVYMNSETKQIDLKVYLWTDHKLSANTDKLLKQTYLVRDEAHKDNPNNGHIRSIDELGTKSKLYLPNILVLTPNTMAVAMFKTNTKTTAQTSFGGLDWLNTSGKVGLVERMIGKTAMEEIDTLTESGFVNKYKTPTLKAFIQINNEAYLTQKAKTKWTNTGIYAGIYAGVIVFLGLMVFILTRGKSNPYKFLNVWECQKISWWAAASPAIIGTLMSLIFSGNAIGQMAFILVVSLRVMWLSMKQLRPVYGQQ